MLYVMYEFDVTKLYELYETHTSHKEIRFFCRYMYWFVEACQKKMSKGNSGKFRKSADGNLKNIDILRVFSPINLIVRRVLSAQR